MATLERVLRRGVATTAKHARAAMEAVSKRPGAGNSKKKNVFDVARLPSGWGVGHRVAKSHWKRQTYYKLCDVKLRKNFFLKLMWRSLLTHKMLVIELHGGYITKKV